MRLVAFVAILGFFFLINAVAAFSMLALGQFSGLIPWAEDEPLAWLIVGLVAVGVSIAFALWLTSASRRVRGRARE